MEDIIEKMVRAVERKYNEKYPLGNIDYILICKAALEASGLQAENTALKAQVKELREFSQSIANAKKFEPIEWINKARQLLTKTEGV